VVVAAAAWAVLLVQSSACIAAGDSAQILIVVAPCLLLQWLSGLSWRNMCQGLAVQSNALVQQLMPLHADPASGCLHNVFCLSTVCAAGENGKGGSVRNRL
jgi:hypothetical protein